ncbi:hypothetical protein Cni_G10591 [Canna indica]|uniref:Protein LURP-one-related 8 n=1 Tax=Canna indica TaxID=4628 RepID=A0AAQ3K4R6_9LILI|nr:hypothetical protein Cni_G10591 [Canna indica]
MSSSRRHSADRSPLVRAQRQNTSFFSPNKASKESHKPSPNPCDNPSVSQSKQKKPRLVIPPSHASNANKTPPSIAKNSYSKGLLRKRVMVFCGLSIRLGTRGVDLFFRAMHGKHLVFYDDGESEVLDLNNEKFEWVEDEQQPPPGDLIRRLRRMSDKMEMTCSEGDKVDKTRDDEEVVSQRGRHGTFDHPGYKWRSLDLALSPPPSPVIFSSSAVAGLGELVPESMAKIHPSAGASAKAPSAACTGEWERAPVVLTVWRKSLLLNGNGFAVFDAKGNLAFRVDNYASGSKAEVLLMDGSGKPLLTIRRKKLSLGEHWLIYEGEEAANPRFAVKRHVNLLPSRALAQVTSCASAAIAKSSYKIEGSYSQRRCAVLDGEGRQLVEIKRKESAGGVAFGLDVFCLVVQPGFDASFAMAIVMLLEQMFGSRASLPNI